MTLAKLAGAARRLDDEVGKLTDLARDLPLTIRIEVQNLQEVLDLLRHKIRGETLRQVVDECNQPSPHATISADAGRHRSRNSTTRTAPK